MLDQQALEYVLSQMDRYTQPSRKKLRERRPKQSVEATRIRVKTILPTVYRMLRKGPQSMADLLTYVNLPPTKENKRAILWIVRCLCDEDVRYNDQLGFRSRGHWLIHDRWLLRGYTHDRGNGCGRHGTGDPTQG